MNITIALYDINDVGGILNHTEQLALGLKELGHHVELAELVWKKKVKGHAYQDECEGLGYVDGVFARIHPKKGWWLHAGARYAYRGGVSGWRNYAKKRDLIIWTIPVPTKRKDQEGNADWPALYDLGPRVKQVAVVHDGNCQKSYPWLMHVAHHFEGLACVHPAAYMSARGLGVPQAMIVNPFDPMRPQVPAWGKRRPGFLACQTFKAWKHVDDVVRMVPHLENVEAHVAGKGIEYQYMTSEDKCKDRYKTEDGQRIWDVAIDAGMTYHGWIHNGQRDSLLRDLRVLIDPSWSKAYAKHGDHFNRTAVEALRMDNILIARNLGISDNEEGIGRVFKPGQHYVMVPWDATPEAFAATVTETAHMPQKRAAEFHEQGRLLFSKFDRKRIAQQYVDLAFGDLVGVRKFDTQADLQQRSDQAIEEFFQCK